MRTDSAAMKRISTRAGKVLLWAEIIRASLINQKDLLAYSRRPVDGTIVEDAELAISKICHGPNNSIKFIPSRGIGFSHVSAVVKSICAGAIRRELNNRAVAANPNNRAKDESAVAGAGSTGRVDHDSRRGGHHRADPKMAAGRLSGSGRILDDCGHDRE